MAKTKTTEKKLENPYLAGRYILWKNIVFSVFFSFFGFSLVKKLKKPKKLKKLKKTVFGRQIYSMEKYSFFSFFSFFQFFQLFWFWLLDVSHWQSLVECLQSSR